MRDWGLHSFPPSLSKTAEVLTSKKCDVAISSKVEILKRKTVTMVRFFVGAGRIAAGKSPR